MDLATAVSLSFGTIGYVDGFTTQGSAFVKLSKKFTVIIS